MSSATLTLPSSTVYTTKAAAVAAAARSLTTPAIHNLYNTSSLTATKSFTSSSSSSTSLQLNSMPLMSCFTQNLNTFNNNKSPEKQQKQLTPQQQQQQKQKPQQHQQQQQQQQNIQNLLLTNTTGAASTAAALTCLHLQHAIYPKNKRKYLNNHNINHNNIHNKERRKRHVANVDGINSYLSLILLVTFTKPLTMWYRFIKSIIFTTTTTTAANANSKTRATQRLFSKVSNKTSSSSSSSSSSSNSSHTSLKSHIILPTYRSSTTSSSSSSSPSKCIRVLPPLGTTTSFFTLLTIICLETILLSTMSSCAKTFYMHWNTSNSIFRIDNTDHIIDVNKGNLAFEFDQVHIICPVYEPGTFDNETEKYIIYNVSKVEYETCRITNADPRVIAICDKPQKLMFFTITFRPFTPQPGGLEFLPGNDYYFISTSSKDDLYRRIGGRCSTNNMKVVFKVCCATEEKNKTQTITTTGSGAGGGGSGGSSTTAVGGAQPTDSIAGNSAEDMANQNQQQTPQQNNHPHHINNINTIGINGINNGMLPNGVMNNNGLSNNQHNGLQLNPIMNSPSGNVATSINTNIDQFNRIPLQPNSINVLSNNIGNGLNMGQMGPGGMSGVGNNGLGLGNHGGSGILLTPGHNGINMIAGNGGVSPMGIPGIHQYPGHGYHGQTGIRINNVPSTHHTNLKNMQNSNNNNDNDHHHYDKHPNEVVKNEELTYNRGAAASMTTGTALYLILLLTLATQIHFWV